MEDLRTLLRFYLGDVGIVVHVVICAAALTVAAADPAPATALLVALGWTSYVIQEHLVHRLIFHAPAPRSQRLFDLLYRLHYGHHDQVQNRHLLFTPLWFSLALGLANFALVSLVAGPRTAVVFVYGGGVASYLLFEWLHLLSHFNARERGRIAWSVTRRHARHHFIDFNNWYTVSPGGSLVDRLLGAAPDEARRVPDTRTCGLEPDDPRLERARARFGRDRSLGNLDARREARAEAAS